MIMHPFLQHLLAGQAVEWKPLGDLAVIKTGQAVSKQMISDNSGQYPVINSGREPLGFIDTWNTDNDPIGITTRGAGVGSITWQEGRYYRGNLNYSVTIKDNLQLNVRFLYHVLLQFQHEIHALCSFSGIPALNASELKKLYIPIPPLSVQTKIAEILDTFTAITAELTAELNIRNQQYQYYRDKLLSVDELAKVGFEWKTLGEVGELIRGNGLQKKDFTETGVPAIHYGQIYTYYGIATTKTISFVSPKLASKLRKVNKGDVIITNTSENLEDVGKALVYLGEEQAVTGGHATIFKPSKEILGKFFAYYTQTKMFFDAKRKFAKGTKVIDVSATDMAKILIPIPPLSEQARIVAILDKFDTLTQSITEGLPREIELRQKQYEYYRERLLGFGNE